MAQRKHVIRSDSKMNPTLRHKIQTFRGRMAGVAEQQPIPNQFTTESDPNSPAVIITDTTTGRQTTVPLFAYRSVRAALTELFAPL